MGVTADSTLWTADTVEVTADGGIVGQGVTADSTAHRADTHCVTADGRVVCIAAEVSEAASAVDATDAAVGANVIAADLFEAAAALDVLDATRVRKPAMAGPWREPLRPVVGYGYGVLPRLEGEAHGTVGHAARGDGELRFTGAAAGEAGDDDLALMLLLLAA